jgi:sRNA-binding regulator protein Hfq/cold shock CspA family protein
VNKNFGFIRTRDNKDLFVHRRQLMNYDNTIFLEGDEVEYELQETEDGIQAKRVKKVRNYGKRLLGDIGSTYLKKLIKEKIKVLVCLTKNRTITGLIKKIKPYEIIVASDTSGEIAIPKLEILYLHKEHYTERLVGIITSNEAIKDKVIDVPTKVTQRFHINNELLKEAFNKNATVKLTLVDGSMVSGSINWFTKYELLFWVHPKANLFVMRHAIVDFTVEKMPEVEEKPKVEVTTKRFVRKGPRNDNRTETVIRRRRINSPRTI